MYQQLAVDQSNSGHLYKDIYQILVGGNAYLSWPTSNLHAITLQTLCFMTCYTKDEGKRMEQIQYHVITLTRRRFTLSVLSSTYCMQESISSAKTSDVLHRTLRIQQCALHESNLADSSTSHGYKRIRLATDGSISRSRAQLFKFLNLNTAV